jgi:hypothetical protein
VSNGNRVMPTQTRPACMSAEEWRLWRQSNRNAGGNKVVSPCCADDCLPEWRAARDADMTCSQSQPKQGDEMLRRQRQVVNLTKEFARQSGNLVQVADLCTKMAGCLRMWERRGPDLLVIEPMVPEFEQLAVAAAALAAEAERLSKG